MGSYTKHPSELVDWDGNYTSTTKPYRAQRPVFADNSEDGNLYDQWVNMVILVFGVFVVWDDGVIEEVYFTNRCFTFVQELAARPLFPWPPVDGRW
jgi:hypothetical protein